MVVEAIKKIEEEGQVSLKRSRLNLKNEKHASTILEETGHISILNELESEKYYRESRICSRKETETQEETSQSWKI